MCVCNIIRNSARNSRLKCLKTTKKMPILHCNNIINALMRITQTIHLKPLRSVCAQCAFERTIINFNTNTDIYEVARNKGKSYTYFHGIIIV